jgi:hypothetical protein
MAAEGDAPEGEVVGVTDGGHPGAPEGDAQGPPHGGGRMLGRNESSLRLSRSPRLQCPILKA